MPASKSGHRQHARLIMSVQRKNVIKLALSVRDFAKVTSPGETDEGAKALADRLAPVLDDIGVTNLNLYGSDRVQDFHRVTTKALAELKKKEGDAAIHNTTLDGLKSLRVMERVAAAADTDGAREPMSTPSRTTGAANKAKSARQGTHTLKKGLHVATKEDKAWAVQRVEDFIAEAEQKGSPDEGYKGAVVLRVVAELKAGNGPSGRKVTAARSTLQKWRTKVKRMEPLQKVGQVEHLTSKDLKEIVLDYADETVGKDHLGVRAAVYAKHKAKCTERGDAAVLHVPMAVTSAIRYEKLVMGMFEEGPSKRHQTQDRIAAMASQRNAASMFTVATSAQTLDNGLNGQDGMVRRACTFNVDKTTCQFDVNGKTFGITLRVPGSRGPEAHSHVVTKGKEPPKTLPMSVGVYPTINGAGDLGPFFILISMSGSETEGVVDRRPIVINAPKFHPRGFAAGMANGAQIVFSFGAADAATKKRVAALENDLEAATGARDRASAAAAAAAAAAAPDAAVHRKKRRRGGTAATAAAAAAAQELEDAEEEIATIGRAVAKGRKGLRPKDRRFFTELYLPSLKKWIAAIRAQERIELGIDADEWDDRLTAAFYLDGAVTELKAIENACVVGSPLFGMFDKALRVVKIGARNTGNEQPLDVSLCFSVLKQLLRSAAKSMTFSTSMRPVDFITGALNEANDILKERQAAAVASKCRGSSVKKGFKGGRLVRLARNLSALQKVLSKAFVQSNVIGGWRNSGLLDEGSDGVWRPNCETIIKRTADMNRKRSGPMSTQEYVKFRVRRTRPRPRALAEITPLSTVTHRANPLTTSLAPPLHHVATVPPSV